MSALAHPPTPVSSEQESPPKTRSELECSLDTPFGTKSIRSLNSGPNQFGPVKKKNGPNGRVHCKRHSLDGGGAYCGLQPAHRPSPVPYEGMGGGGLLPLHSQGHPHNVPPPDPPPHIHEGTEGHTAGRGQANQRWVHALCQNDLGVGVCLIQCLADPWIRGCQRAIGAFWGR